MTTWLNHVTIRTGGAGSHTVDPSNPTAGGAVLADGSAFTPTAGRFLICVVASPVSASTPSGWTLGSGASAIGTTELYVFHKTAAGGDTLATNHDSGSFGVTFDFYEFDAAASFQSAAAFVASASGATETISGLTGTSFVMAFVITTDNASPWTITGATEHFDYNGGGSAGRYAAASVFTTGSSVGVTATLATHQQVNYAISGLTDAVAASATGSLSLSGSAGGAGVGTATGSLSLSGQAASGQPASGTGAVTLAGSAVGGAAATAGGSLTLTATGGVTAAVSATGSLNLSAIAEAVPLYETDTTNIFRGLSIRMTAEVLVTTPYASSIAPATPAVDKALAVPLPVLVKGRPT